MGGISKAYQTLIFLELLMTNACGWQSYTTQTTSQQFASPEAAANDNGFLPEFGESISINGEVVSLPGFLYRITGSTGKAQIDLRELMMYTDEEIFSYQAPFKYGDLKFAIVAGDLKDKEHCAGRAFASSVPKFKDLPPKPATYTFCVEVRLLGKEQVTYFRSPSLAVIVEDAVVEKPLDQPTQKEQPAPIVSAENPSPTLNDPALLINSGLTFTTTEQVNLKVDGGSASEMYITNAPGCATGGVWEALTSHKNWTLAQRNGLAVVYVKIRNSEHVESRCVLSSIIHDSEAPTSPSLSINRDAAYTAGPAVSLALAAGGAQGMYVTNTKDCQDGGSWESFAPDKAWTLGQANGIATVYAKFRDAAGLESACISDSITELSMAPNAPSLSINAGATYTRNPLVSLEIGGRDGSEIYVTNTPDCADGGQWEAFSLSKSWSLAQRNGLAHVYIKLRNQAQVESACVSSSIIHDAEPPTGGRMVINNGDATTASTAVTLALAATDSYEMYITNSADCLSDGVWESFAPSKAWTVIQTESEASVYVVFRDVAGNMTECMADAITHHTPPPAQKKVYAYASAQYTNQVHGFALDTSSGQLSPLATPSVDAQTLPMITASAVQGAYLLAANYSSHSVSSFSINPRSGVLTLVEHQALAAGSGPSWVVVHQGKNVAYTADAGKNTLSILDVNPANGDLTVRGSVAAGAGVTALDINATGTLLYTADQGADQVGIFAIDQNGDLSSVGSAALPAGSQVNHVKLSPDGRFLYTANWGRGSVSAFAVAGQGLTSVGSEASSGSGGVYMLSVSPDGSRVYAAKPYGGEYSVFPVDAVTGALGSGANVTQAGSVNFSFYGDFGFAVAWTSSAAGLPIETHAYTQAAGLAPAILYASPGLRGLYQLTIVEVMVSP